MPMTDGSPLDEEDFTELFDAVQKTSLDQLDQGLRGMGASELLIKAVRATAERDGNSDAYAKAVTKINSMKGAE